MGLNGPAEIGLGLTIHTSHNVAFFENKYFFQLQLDFVESPYVVSLPDFSDKIPFVKFDPNFVYHRRGNAATTDSPLSDPPTASGPTGNPPLCRSSWISVPPTRYGFTHTSLMATMSSTSIPNSYSQALQHECWNKAMQDELDALVQNLTSDVVPCPPPVKPISCKWIYSIKLKLDGTLDWYKARLVALGNR